MKKIITFLFILCCLFSAIGLKANGGLDSLLTVVDQSKVGSTTYFKTLSDIIGKYDQTKVSINLDSLNDILIANAIELDSHYYHVRGLHLKANTLSYKEEYDRALLLRQQGIEISQKHGLYREEANHLMELALIKAYASDDYEIGFPEIEKSILICKEHNLEDLLARDYCIMSYFYVCLHQKKDAYPEARKTEAHQNYLKKSVEYIDKAIDLVEKLNDTELLEVMQGQRINTLLQLGSYQEAIDQANKVLDSKRKRPFENIRMDNEYVVIAKSYQGLNKLDLAHLYLDSAKQIVVKNNGFQDLLHIEGFKVRWAMEQENYKEAVDLLLKNQVIRDSFWRAEKKAAFDELALKFETVQKEKENILLTSEKEMLLSRNELMRSFTVFALLVLAVLIFFLLKNRKQLLLINQQKQQLELGLEEKNRFFANVTHEFRTPLTLIVGPLKQLLKNDQLESSTLAKLSTMEKSSEQLLNLVDEITDLSKYERGQLTVKNQPAHLLTYLNNWVDQFQEESLNRKIAFKLNYLLPSDLTVNIDIEKLRKIVFNLLSNAFKFSQSNDSIVFEVSEQGRVLRFKVTDTGIGMDRSELTHIFERFYQSKNATNGGLGIGLHYCKNLVELMKGTINVVSKVGEGSSFVVDLPKLIVNTEPVALLSSGPQQAPDRSVEIPLIPQYSNRTILIVEDNFQMQGYINEMLSPICYTVLANNGKVALEVLKNKKVDLIVTDLMMPEMDGYRMLDILKNDPAHQNIPVIILTAKTGEKDRLKGVTLGVDDYLTKPFEQEELLASVQNILVNQQEKERAIAEEEEGEEITSDKIILSTRLPKLESANLQWLKKLEKIAFQKVTEPNFTISELAYELSVGERQLNRRLKSLTGLTPGNYIKEIKLQKARQLLESQHYKTVAEVSYFVGFNTPDYFSTIYKKRFGKRPSEYLRSKV